MLGKLFADGNSPESGGLGAAPNGYATMRGRVQKLLPQDLEFLGTNSDGIGVESFACSPSMKPQLMISDQLSSAPYYPQIGEL